MGLLALKARSASTAAAPQKVFELREPRCIIFQIKSTNSKEEEVSSALFNSVHCTPEVNKVINLALTKMKETYELEALIRTTLNLKPAVEREKAVQAIAVHREFKNYVVTLRVMSQFLNFLGAARGCADFRDPTAGFRLNRINRNFDGGTIWQDKGGK